MSYDSVPVVAAAAVLTAAPALPGPTRDEWAGAAFGVLALVVRELVWWIRNRGAR